MGVAIVLYWIKDILCGFKSSYNATVWIKVDMMFDLYIKEKARWKVIVQIKLSFGGKYECLSILTDKLTVC